MLSAPESEAGELFAWVATYHRRNSDPVTSHQSAAAARHFATGHAALCLDALRLNGPATQTELAQRVGLLPHQVNKRLADLHRHGLIVTTGNTRPGHANRMEREWKTA